MSWMGELDSIGCLVAVVAVRPSVTDPLFQYGGGSRGRTAMVACSVVACCRPSELQSGAGAAPSQRRS